VWVLKADACGADELLQEDQPLVHTHTAAMVLIKIGIVAAAIAGLMFMAQSQRWFERAGLLARCQEATRPYGSTQRTGQWWSCTEGAVSGFKNLERQHCENKGVIGHTQLWYCPTPIGRP